MRGCDRVLKNKTIEVKAETYEAEVRERRGVTDVAHMGYSQDVLVSMNGSDGETTCEVAGRPLVLVDG